MIDPIFHEFSTISDVCKEASISILSRINNSVNEFDKINIFLSGGSSPIQLYESLASKLDKKLVELFQVDERWVNPESNRSNQRMINSIFTDNYQFYRMGTPNLYETPETAAKEYDRLLFREMNEENFVIGIYGMGTDAHTASLFPDEFSESELEEPMTFSCFVRSQGEYRISLTPKAINLMNYKILLIFGREKGKKLAEVLNSSNVEKYPVLILFENECHVFLDEEAMKGFNEE